MRLLKLPKLFFQLLRYRVAVMLLMFLLLGIAVHDGLTGFSVYYLYAAISVICGYVAATSINDIADEKIDKVNHPGSEGRPLVSGEASVADLYTLNGLSAAASVLFAFIIGNTALVIALISVTISYAYSLRPAAISHRTHGAYFLLAVAYVLLPYWLGVAATGAVFGISDLYLTASLMALFFGRILLKDFRDRKGDTAYGKPTFLLKYGKRATVTLSAISILAGNALLLLSLRENGIIKLLLLEILFVLIYASGYMLLKARSFKSEQVAIGLGAKLGNGVVLSLLGLFILKGYNAPEGHALFFQAAITMLFAASFAYLAQRPKIAIIGYRG
ncbi:UbiA prenyltransferase family protein [Candidatus Woesearchaeota archaeon]|nr:UbiA prenyltransferase family protein [Candidatus Woesearchaeota archaeon]